MGEAIKSRVPKAGKHLVADETFEVDEGHVFEVPKTIIAQVGIGRINFDGSVDSEFWFEEVPNPFRSDQIDQEKLNQRYREEGWGALAEAAGFNPYHTESSARTAFRFCAEIIKDKDAEIKALRKEVADLERTIIGVRGSAPY